MDATVETLEKRLSVVERELEGYKYARIPERLAAIETTLEGHTQLLTKLDIDVCEVGQEVAGVRREVTGMRKEFNNALKRNLALLVLIFAAIEALSRIFP